MFWLRWKMLDWSQTVFSAVSRASLAGGKARLTLSPFRVLT